MGSEITKIGNVKKVLEMFAELTEIVGAVDSCLSVAIEKMSELVFSGEIRIPKTVKIRCEKTVEYQLGKVEVIDKPSIVEVRDDVVYIRSAENNFIIGIRSISSLKINTLLMLLLYEKHCQVLTKLIHALNEQEQSLENILNYAKRLLVVSELLLG